MAVITSKVVQVPEFAKVPVGTTWLFEGNDTFTVPVDGNYQIELHGGGGGSACFIQASAGGGGSGELIELALSKGDKWDITIGAGGAKTSDGSAGTGGTTYFGSFAQPGGGGGRVDGYNSLAYAGSAVGSLATSGSAAPYNSNSSGGQGNKNNVAQTYGDGGAVAGGKTQNGQPGAVIITYLGVS